MLSVVYGANCATQREQLWEDLRLINLAHGQIPWAILGYFNIARYMDEKLGGNKLTFKQLTSFNTLIDDLSLSEIRSSANYWSWHNNVGDRRILVRLARVLCNDIWLTKLPESSYEAMSI